MRLACLALLLCPGLVRADAVHVDVGVSFRSTSTIDLARAADADGFGSADDTSPGALGLRVGLGYAVDEWVELWVDGRVGVGGLNLAKTEVRYFGSEDTVGSAVSAEAGLHALFGAPAGDWRFLVGPGALLHTMTAASGPGTVGVRSVGLGGRGGLRWRANPLDSGFGYLELDGDVHWHLPTRIFAEGGETLFDAAGGRGFLSIGVSLVYGWAFDV